MCHPQPTATYISCEQLAQCTGVPGHLARLMLDTKGCEILSAARILLHLGIGRLRIVPEGENAGPVAGALLDVVHRNDRKLASNFIRHIDSMQSSLTPALEAIMSQHFDTTSQTGACLTHTTRQVVIREFPRLCIITSRISGSNSTTNLLHHR